MQKGSLYLCFLILTCAFRNPPCPPAHQLIGIQYLCPEYALHVYCISPNRTPRPPKKLNPVMPELCAGTYKEQEAFATHHIHARDTLIIRLYDVRNKAYLPARGPWCDKWAGPCSFREPIPPFYPADTASNEGVKVPASHLLAPDHYRQIALTPGEFNNGQLELWPYKACSATQGSTEGATHTSILGEEVLQAMQRYYSRFSPDTCVYRNLHMVYLEVHGQP